MNPASPEFHNRAATSPALFNRCVLDWFGEWSAEALFQVGSEFTRNLDLENPSYLAPSYFPEPSFPLPMPPSHRDAVVSSLVYVHQTIGEANIRYTINFKLFYFTGPNIVALDSRDVKADTTMLLLVTTWISSSTLWK